MVRIGPLGSCMSRPLTFSTSGDASTAIQNYTIRFGLDQDDIDLRFLVHYVGSMRLLPKSKLPTR